jgi:hypothetical protein
VLDAALASLLADPWRIVLGGGGVVGLVALVVRWWRNRPRVKARYLGETFDTAGNPNMNVDVEIEVENVGREPTSLAQDVEMQCLTARRESLTATFHIHQGNRTLPPVTPSRVTLRATVPANYVFSHFRVFRFRLTRGGSIVVRVLNASGAVAPAAKFYCLRVLFRLGGLLPHVDA